MKVLLMVSSSISKIVLFFFVLFFAMASQRIYISLVPILLAAMLVISGITTISFLVCYLKNYGHKEWKILFKVTIASAFEFLFLGLAYVSFWKLQAINSVGFLWFIPFFATVYWCFPRQTYSKKRNG